MNRVIAGSMLVLSFAGAAACGSSNAPPAPPPPQSAGGTGAFGIVTVNGTQKLYLPQLLQNPAGHGYVSVVDLGVPGNGVQGAPALITDIDLGGPDFATTTNGTSNIVVAASTQSSNVWLIDPASDTVVKTVTLDPSYGPPGSGFSGGGGIVTGIAMDPANHRAILSVWNGFAILDLDAQAITSTIQAPPSENFGFDAMNQRIIAPFYDCMASMSGAADGGIGMSPSFCNSYMTESGTPMTDGLNVIDLKDGTVYTYQDPMAADPTAPVGHEPDSAAADPNTQVIVIPSEGEGSQTVIDLSKATFDKNKKVVSAPHQIVENVGLTGVAVEATNHFAFWEEEHSGGIALADLNALNSGAAADGGVGAVAQGVMPNTPADEAGAGSGWSNLGDPHGVAVATGIANGHPIGVVVDSGLRWVARVDLSAVWAAPHSMGSIQDSDLAAATTMLDARTKK
jgi:hypothetical protein